jgi:ubiquinone/menaquinone biosynthesis C-methylase UbiE
VSRFFWALYAMAYDTLARLRPYQAMLRECIRLLRIRPNVRVLDAGCGTGNLVARLHHDGAWVLGADFSEGMLERARRKIGNSPRAHLEFLDLRGVLPYPEGAFDRVACVNTLHAIPEPAPLIQEFARVLKPGGILVVTTPLPKPSPGAVFGEHLRYEGWAGVLPLLPALLVVLVCNLFMLRRSRFFKPEELEGLLEWAGFSVSSVGLTYADQNVIIAAERR